MAHVASLLHWLGSQGSRSSETQVSHPVRGVARWGSVDKKGGPSIDFADSSEYAISQPSVVKVNGGGYRIGYGTASSGRCVADSLALLGCHRGGERSGIVFRCSPGTAGRRLHGRGGLHAQGCRLSFSVRRSVDISGLGRSAFSEGECVTKVPIRKAIGTDFTASAFLPRNPGESSRLQSLHANPAHVRAGCCAAFASGGTGQCHRTFWTLFDLSGYTRGHVPAAKKQESDRRT